MFSNEIYEIFKNTSFLQNNSTLMAASGSKQCKPMKTHWKFILPKKEMIYLNGTCVFLDNVYSSEVFQTLLAVPYFGNVARKSQKQSSRRVL